MRYSRRRLLTFAAFAPLSQLVGCAPDPGISPNQQLVNPTSSALPTTPGDPTAQPPALAAAAATQLAKLHSLVAAGADLVDAPAGYATGVQRLQAQCNAQLDRLLSADPLTPKLARSFQIPTEPAPRFADFAGFEAELHKVIAAAVTVMRENVSKASSQPERLLYASLAAGVTAARQPVLTGKATAAAPIRFPDTDPKASLKVALSHVFALAYGLELGLGRLLAEDPLLAPGRLRLNQLQALRAELREAIVESVEQQVSYRLPNPMQQPAQIKAGWAELEYQLLEALARLVASDPKLGTTKWLELMLAQVGHVQSWDGQLPTWPGWAAA